MQKQSLFSIEQNYQQIKQRIAIAKQGAKRSDTIKLLAVSKHHKTEKIISLVQLGQKDFGESYLQEAQQKIAQLQQYPINWHFIGPIQSNKTRPIANLFDWVHSVDRLKIAQRLNDQRVAEKPVLNICLQININNEQNKAGFSLVNVDSVIGQIMKLPHLQLRGLMAIPIKTNHTSLQKENFLLLRKKLMQLNQQFSLNMDTLSMGMSNDLEAAIFAGSTLVRVGSALFGKRAN